MCCPDFQTWGLRNWFLHEIRVSGTDVCCKMMVFRTAAMQNFQAFKLKLGQNLIFQEVHIGKWHFQFWGEKCFVLLKESSRELDYASTEGLKNWFMPQLGVLGTGAEAWKGSLLAVHSYTTFQLCCPPLYHFTRIHTFKTYTFDNVMDVNECNRYT